MRKTGQERQWNHSNRFCEWRSMIACCLRRRGRFRRKYQRGERRRRAPRECQPATTPGTRSTSSATPAPAICTRTTTHSTRTCSLFKFIQRYHHEKPTVSSKLNSLWWLYQVNQVKFLHIKIVILVVLVLIDQYEMVWVVPLRVNQVKYSFRFFKTITDFYDSWLGLKCKRNG